MIISILLIVAVILAVYLPLKLNGVLDDVDTASELKELILSGGGYSYFIFFALQFLQVTFIPLPAMVTTLAGALVFGPWITFLLSIVAILMGSFFAFFLGRKVGRSVVYWIVGKQDADKWIKKLENGKYVFFLMMLFPVFPDDILCLIAGMTAISWSFFTVTNLITRPIGVFATCFFGSGVLIPFSGWGIVVWIIIAIVLIVLFYCSIKYKKNIENFVVSIGEKFDIKKKYENSKATTESNKLETAFSENLPNDTLNDKKEK